MLAQLEEPLERLTDRLPADTIGALVAVAATLLACYGAWRLFRRRTRPSAIGEEELSIDVDTLSTDGPPSEGPSLAYYGMPTRLAALVLAPAGRDRRLPPFDRLDEVLEHIVPGLSQVHLAHKPVFRRWPNQLSVRGFAHKYFARVRLIEHRDRLLPWCSVAGVFKIEGQSYLVGMLLRTATPTNFGRRIVDDATQWLSVLRVQREGTNRD